LNSSRLEISRSRSFEALERAQKEVSPDAITLPVMTAGATGSSFLGTKDVQAYGIGVSKTDEERRGVHGNDDDERVHIKQLGLFVRYLCCCGYRGCGGTIDGPERHTQAPNRSAARAFAFAASSSRFLGGAFVSSECRRRVEIAATSSIAPKNAVSFAFDGLLKPLIFLTNWSEAARTSSAVTGGSKLKRVLIFRHIQ
jgi:hypothetical protein